MSIAPPDAHEPLAEPSVGEVRRIVRLAWPVVLGQLGMMLMGVVDVVIVGHLSKEALGAVALGHTWTFGTMIIALGTASGLDPVIAQAFGGGRREDAGLALVRGAVLLGLFSVPVMLAHWWAEPGLRLLGQPEVLVPMAADYVRVLTFSVPPMLAFSLLRQFLQGAGRMRPAAVAVVVTNVVNAALCYGLVYGELGLPELGAVGAGWATLAARCLMPVLLFAMGFDLVRACWPGLARAFDVGALVRLARIGVPVGVQVAMEVWAFTGTTIMMGWIDETAVAAHMVALNLASISFMVPFGISAAAATRVGNLLGAGRPWTRAAWAAVAVGAGVMALSATLFFLVPHTLARMYSEDAAVVALAASLLPIAALFQLFDGTQVVCFGVLRGAGDTRLPALANLVGYWLIGLPIGGAAAFGWGWGPRGLWLGLTLGLATVAGLLLLRLRATAARGGYRVV